MPNHKRLKFFEKDPIEWTGKYELQGFYKTLFTLRTENPALNAHSQLVQLPTSDDAHLLAYLRKSNGREVLVVLNFSGADSHFNLTDNGVNGTYKDVFSGASTTINPQTTITLPAWQYLVFEK
jgi:glycosidase